MAETSIPFQYTLTFQLNLATGILRIIDESSSPSTELDRADISSETAYELRLVDGGSAQKKLVRTPDHQISNPDFHFQVEMNSDLKIFIHHGKLEIDLPPSSSGIDRDIFLIGEDDYRTHICMEMPLDNKITLEYNTTSKILQIRMKKP